MRNKSLSITLKSSRTPLFHTSLSKKQRTEWFVCLSHTGGYIFVTSFVRDAILPSNHCEVYCILTVKLDRNQTNRFAEIIMPVLLLSYEEVEIKSPTPPYQILTILDGSKHCIIPFRNHYTKVSRIVVV